MFSHSDTLLNDDSPQYQAACWIHDDPTDMGQNETLDEFRVKQRYALAVFYFSLIHGSTWSTEHPVHFLSSTSECEWTGITCDDNTYVTEIDWDQYSTRAQSDLWFDTG